MSTEDLALSWFDTLELKEQFKIIYPEYLKVKEEECQL